MNYGNVKLIYILLTIWSFTSISSSLMAVTFDEISAQNGLLHLVMVFCQLFLEVLALVLVVFKGASFIKTGKFVLFWLSFSFLITLFQHSELLTDLRTIFWWPSIYLLFYDICAKDSGKYRELLFNTFIPIIFIGCSAIFIALRIAMFSALGFNTASNDVYYIILLMPFIPLIKRKTIQYIFIIIGIVLALYSFKRGAQICIVLSMLLYVFVNMRRSKISSFKKVMALVVVTGSMIGLFAFVNAKTEGYIVTRFDEIEESGGSGREDIYSRVTKEFEEQGFLTKLVGCGINGVKKHYHVANDKDGRSYSAHNDFLEMLADFGYIGLFIYILIILNYFKDVFKCRKGKDIAYYQSGLMGLSIFLVMSMVSHLFLYPTFVAYSSMLFGVIGGYKTKLRSYQISAL